MDTGRTDWLERRRELLERAIAEMQAHLERPCLDPQLNPDVAGCLAWAKAEVERLSAQPPQAASSGDSSLAA